MPTPELSQIIMEHNKVLPGFRLRRLEMFNWGTFHQKVAVIAPEGHWTLLVGENGSGKSTAVDALRTLLVPPRLLNYNDASGDQKRRDRTRRSYVRGAWATSSQEESPAARVEYLRKEGEQTILLGVFANEHTGAAVTLAQILWEVNDKVDEIFSVARGDKSIRRHLSNLGKTNELKKSLRAREFEPFDSFPGYEATFRNRLGIPSRGALEVFNQAIGVKEVIDINSFIRRHMLELSDAGEFINTQLRPHYKELDACWQAIQKAEAQIEKLEPIANCYRRIEEAKQRKHELDNLQQIARSYYARRHLDLQLAEASRLEISLNDLIAKQLDLHGFQERDNEQRDAILRELAADSVEQSIQRIDDQILRLIALKRSKEEKHDGIKVHLANLGKSVSLESEEDFRTLRENLIQEKGLLEESRKFNEDEQLRFKVEQTEALKQREEAAAEIESLRQHRVLIPREFVAIRHAVSEATGVPTDDLPFAGELLEVKTAFREWTGAIERLLHSFGISLLVPERHYLSVTRYINESRLMHDNQGVRLTYYRVPVQAVMHRLELLDDSSRVSARMNFRHDHDLHHWVKSELCRRFTHVCCQNVQRLKEEDYGITREGLIRNGPTQHIKDDRRAVNDISSYVLGWSIQSKIEAFTAELERAEKQASKAGKAAQQMGEQIKKLDDQLSGVAMVLAIEHFNDIDFRLQQEELIRLQKQKEELEETSDKRKALKKQRESLTQAIQHRQRAIDELTEQIGGLKRDQRQNVEIRDRLTKLLVDSPDFDPTPWYGPFTDLQDEKLLTLDNVTTVQEKASDRLRGRINHQTGLINSAVGEMLPQMANFLRDYPEESVNLKADTDYGREFVALRERIDKEDLPKHRERFEKFLGTNLIGDMAMFNTKLGEHEKEIRTRVFTVNKALQSIPFSNGTHVQIVLQPSRTDEIRSFRAELKNCLSSGLNPSTEDRIRIFGQIRDLISKFERDENWTRRVTDARNWLDFGVKEVTDSDGKEMNYYAASSGKSGGQKVKLAFTILASAIAAQYGLAGANDQSETFRLVVIDEAFARTDEPNSHRALQLFQSLGLQLLVVSPFDAKGRIVEDYVESFHLVVNPDGNSSHIRVVSRAGYEAAREDSTPILNAQS